MWRNESIYRTLGLVPEREEMYAFSGWEFVLANARLHRLPDPEAAARRALEIVQMTDVQDRDVRTYSKGMKQRIKMATAVVHDPEVLLLDEPFNGMDPRQRLQLMELLHTMGDSGRTVLFSSHILEEVEQIAGRIEVMVAGRHAASGNFREIRRLMTQRPAPVHRPLQRRPGVGIGVDRRPEHLERGARLGQRRDRGQSGGRCQRRPHPGRRLPRLRPSATPARLGPRHPAA